MFTSPNPSTDSKTNSNPISKSNHALARWMLVMLACSFIALEARMGEITHDAFHEMALVRTYLETGVFPQSDLFAYTHTVDPSIHHEWGTGAILYLVCVTSGLGLTGLSLLKWTLIAILWVTLYRVARLRGAHPILFAAFSLVVFPVLWVGFATIRATLFTLVFIAIQLWMQEKDARGHRLWIVPWWLMMVAWLNIHAGFVVGFGLMAFHAAECFIVRTWRTQSIAKAWYASWHLAAALLSVIVSLPINPYGWQYGTYLVHGLTMPRPEIVEWQPLWYTHDPVCTVSMFALSLLLIGLILRQRLGLESRGIASLALCGFQTLKHLRHGPIYAILWIAYVPAWLTHTRLGREIVAYFRRQPWIAMRIAQGVSVATLVFASVNGFGLSTLNGPHGTGIAAYPTGPVDYLQRHAFRGNLLTPFHCGAYVSWELAPNVKVSLDGRYEVAYAADVLPDHFDFFFARQNWQELLTKYPHDAILVNKSAPIFSVLQSTVESQDGNAFPREEPWRLTFEDDLFALYCRSDLALPREEHLQEAIVDRSHLVFAPHPPYPLRSTVLSSR